MKKTYKVAPGVAWVNGARVPADRKVQLTDAEARFDIEQGRVTLDEDVPAAGVVSPERRRGRKDPDQSAEADG